MSQRAVITKLQGVTKHRHSRTAAIQYAVMASIAALSGAGVSFAPLYERIWGGMMLHPQCPVIGRMTYTLSDLVRSDTSHAYGACVTSPAWFVAVSLLCVVMVAAVTATIMTIETTQLVAAPSQALATTRDGHDSSTRQRQNYIRQCMPGTAIAIVAMIAILVLGANLFNLISWGMYALLWWVYWRLDSNPTARYALLAIQIGVMPVLITEYAVSDEINVSGGVIVACGMGLFASALAGIISRSDISLKETRTLSTADSVSLVPIVALLLILAWVLVCGMAWRYHAWTRTDFCPALSADGTTLVGYCIGSDALAVLSTLVVVLILASMVAVIGSIATVVVRRMRTAAWCCMLSALCAASAFVIAFTLA